MKIKTLKIKGTILKFGAEHYSRDVISSFCEIDIPERVPILFDFDFEKSIGYAEVVRTDEGLVFTGEITDPAAIEILTKTHDGKECRGCGGYYNCVERDDLNQIVKMKLRAVSSTYAPVNPEYTFEIVEGSVRYENLSVGDTFKLAKNGDKRVFRKEKEGAIQIVDSSGNSCEELGHMMYPYIGFPVYIHKEETE